MIFYMFLAFNIITSVSCVMECYVDTTFPVNPCKQNSTNYFDCLRNCAEELWPQIIDGFPKFNIPILDPFFYGNSKYVINEGEIYGELYMYNVTVIGPRKTHFLTIRVYFRDDGYHFEVNVKVPRLIIDGDSNAIGSLGAIRMGGKGYFNLSMENVKATFYITGHAENDTLVIEHFRIIPIVEKLKFHLDDFFEGNKEFNDLLETFVNEFWPSLYRTFLPIMIDVWDLEFTNLFNHLLPQISISQIFP